jgi:hypothetical protein
MNDQRPGKTLFSWVCSPLEKWMRFVDGDRQLRQRPDGGSEDRPRSAVQVELRAVARAHQAVLLGQVHADRAAEVRADAGVGVEVLPVEVLLPGSRGHRSAGDETDEVDRAVGASQRFVQFVGIVAFGLAEGNTDQHGPGGDVPGVDELHFVGLAGHPPQVHGLAGRRRPRRVP